MIDERIGVGWGSQQQLLWGIHLLLPPVVNESFNNQPDDEDQSRSNRQLVEINLTTKSFICK
jgi:hypothetical protein